MPSVDSVLSKPKGEKKEPESESKSGHKKHKKEMRIRQLDDGSHMIEHHGEGEMTEHSAPDMDALHDHLEQHMGQPNEGEQAMAAPQGDAGGAPAAGGEPMPAQGA